MAVTKDQVIDFIANMSVLDLSQLVKELEDKFGVSAAAAAVAAPAAAAPAAAAEEKTQFDVILKAGGDKKINVIKEIRTLMGLGLKEAKDFVDAPGGKVKEGVSKDEAAAVKKVLEEQGATVEIA